MKCKLALRRVNFFALSKDVIKIFSSFKSYQLHLNIRHMVDINNNTLNLKIFEGNNNVNSNLYIIKYLIINIILRSS